MCRYGEQPPSRSLIGLGIFGTRGLPIIRIIAGRWVEHFGSCKSHNSAGIAHIELLIDVNQG
jgi:hypothetical protein